MKLKVNKKAPNFRLPSTGKSKFELNKIKKNIILYFYPKDDTPGCTIETNEFRSSARRPKYSVLSSENFKKEFKIRPRPWELALEDCLSKMIK